MAEISKIQLPNGNIYDLKDEVARAMDLVVTYTAATYDLAITIDSAETADDEEF